MRREILYLTDIIEAADHIAAFISGLDLEGFRKSEMVRSAVVQKLAIIGEAAARVSEPVRTRHPEIPWPQIIAFKNILIHAYFGIDWDESGELPRIAALFCGSKSLRSSRRSRAIEAPPVLHPNLRVGAI